MSRKALDRGSEEEIGIELKSTGEMIALIEHKESEIELSGAGMDFKRGEGEIRERERRRRRVLEDKHNLKERGMGEIAVGMEKIDQHLKGEILMSKGIETGLANLSEEIEERRLGGEIGTQDKSVDEETDKRLNFRAGAVGDGRADRDIVLGGKAEEEDLEGSQQGHEESGIGGKGEGAQAGREIRGEVEGEEGAVERLERRAGMIGGEFEESGEMIELLLPEVELVGEDLAGEPGTLPGGEVGVLDGEIGERGGLPGGKGWIQG